ncbi:MAG: glycosyltransferase family 2 protein [Clostridiales bacterium]|jgi:dolichol-phosphate mannosyltransferase|nr:glycosyltransferase family 2 protein [Clostridiales bacterium]
MYSVIVPVYNEEAVIEEAHKRLTAVMRSVGGAYELLYVNDGSGDGTARILRRLAEGDKCVRLLEFSRNFGHQAAITAGTDFARGDAVIIIDADLQDPPEVIPRMIEKWREGFEVVYGKRAKRKGETAFKKLTAAAYYRLLRRLTDVPLPVDAGDFRLLDKKVCAELKKIREKNRYVRGIVNWVGFRHTYVEYIRDERFAGQTKYTLRKMLRFAADGVTSFSSKPLTLASYLGAAFWLAGVICLIAVLAGFSAAWAATLIIAAFSNGTVLVMLGLTGEYIGRIYDESKQRPLYILRDKVGFDNAEGD